MLKSVNTFKQVFIIGNGSSSDYYLNNNKVRLKSILDFIQETTQNIYEKK